MTTLVNRGDKVRVTLNHPSGSTAVYEGVASAVDEDSVCVEGLGWLYATVEYQTVEVLERAKVEPVPGDVFLVNFGRYTQLRYCHGDGVVVDGEGLPVGFASDYVTSILPIERFIIRNGEVVS